LLWNCQTKQVENEISPQRGTGYPKSLAFSNDSKYIAFGGEGMALYEVANLNRYSFYPGDAVLVTAFSPDDRFLALVRIRGTVAIWSMTENAVTSSLSHPRAPNAGFLDESVAF